ncbi:MULTISPECIES: DUF6098 family protein [Streptomyces]|uniref:DUF6098 family protein n=1 Tax=Streptomyces TaxID=1883 RepID=UPI0035AC222C
MPGLSADPLDVEEWRADRPVRVWAARRPHDYGQQLPPDKVRGVRPRALTGRETGRGPGHGPPGGRRPADVLDRPPGHRGGTERRGAPGTPLGLVAPTGRRGPALTRSAGVPPRGA